MRRIILLALVLFAFVGCQPATDEGPCVRWARAYVAKHPGARIAGVYTRCEWKGIASVYVGSGHAVVVLKETENLVLLVDNGYLFDGPTWVPKEVFDEWFVRWLE